MHYDIFAGLVRLENAQIMLMQGMRPPLRYTEEQVRITCPHTPRVTSSNRAVLVLDNHIQMSVAYGSSSVHLRHLKAEARILAKPEDR